MNLPNTQGVATTRWAVEGWPRQQLNLIPTAFTPIPDVAQRRCYTLLILVVVCLLAHRARCAEWVGRDAKIENGNNWMNNLHGAVMVDSPHLGRKNATRLSVLNGSGFPLRFTGVNGTTEFNEQLLIGAFQGPSGELRVTGETLTVHQTCTAVIGQTVNAKMEVQSGTGNLLGDSTDHAVPGADVKWSLQLGNKPNGYGLITVSGGDVRIENGMQIGRNGGSGILEISGNGQFICGGPILFTGDDSAKFIIFGIGNGPFEQNNPREILFPGDQGWFNFKSVSRGKLSLYGYDRVAFEHLVIQMERRSHSA